MTRNRTPETIARDRARSKAWHQKRQKLTVVPDLHMGVTVNREAWLQDAAHTLMAYVANTEGAPAPGVIKDVRVTNGWPSRNARPGKKQAIGECWDGTMADDGIPQLFISPMLVEPVKVLETLIHELVHAVVGNDAAHKGPFVKLMKAIGLEGKPTSTHAGDTLKTYLASVAEILGPYPHSGLRLVDKAKQGTRLIKATCLAQDCGCVIRITQKWIDAAAERNECEDDDRGCLICPVCQSASPMEIEQK